MICFMSVYCVQRWVPERKMQFNQFHPLNQQWISLHLPILKKNSIQITFCCFVNCCPVILSPFLSHAFFCAVKIDIEIYILLLRLFAACFPLFIFIFYLYGYTISYTIVDNGQMFGKYMNRMERSACYFNDCLRDETDWKVYGSYFGNSNMICFFTENNSAFYDFQADRMLEYVYNCDMSAGVKSAQQIVFRVRNSVWRSLYKLAKLTRETNSISNKNQSKYDFQLNLCEICVIINGFPNKIQKLSAFTSRKKNALTHFVRYGI